VALNKQGPEKIDWTDYTWNPISGCKHGCDYCYVKRLEDRFKNNMMTPALHPSRYDDIAGLTKPSNIFTGSSGDMWGAWVPRLWIRTVLDIVLKYPQHTFQFLTKNPSRYGSFDLPSNAIYGTTIDGSKRTRGNMVKLIHSVAESKAFISFEPLLEPIPMHEIVYLAGVNWIIIGADSNAGAKRPLMHWAGALIAAAKQYKIPVFVKDNYGYPEKFKEMP
jgi:protein gp37